MQEFRNIQQNDETALQFAYSRDVSGFAFGKYAARSFDLGGGNFEHFRSRVYDETDQFVVQLNDENAVLLIGLNFRLAKSFAKVHDGNDFPAQIDDAFNQIARAGNGGNFRDTDNFAHGGDADAVRFIADAKTDDLKILFHGKVSGS